MRNRASPPTDPAAADAVLPAARLGAGAGGADATAAVRLGAGGAIATGGTRLGLRVSDPLGPTRPTHP
jgi:hypothetical protein